jgi:hypothetical protein
LLNSRERSKLVTYDFDVTFNASFLNSYNVDAYNSVISNNERKAKEIAVKAEILGGSDKIYSVYLKL